MPRARAERIGVFGGTFDPPHVGHLILAEWARQQLRLDRVLFIPAGLPPHKRERRASPVEDRVAMTRAAVRGNPAFRVDTLEARRRGPSFTVDTLRALRRRHPRARLYLIVGQDSLNEMRTWREPEAILRLATPVVAARPGSARAGRAPRRIVVLANPPVDLSSSTVRARARGGRSIRYLVPEGVARYVERHGLYRAARRVGSRVR